MRYVVFTDLDGTLLDHETYSVRGAVSALDLLSRRQVEVVPVTSKTAAEIRKWMQHLMLTGPYVSENGGGITIPGGYFDRIPPEARKESGNWVIHLGQPVVKVREMLSALSFLLGLIWWVSRRTLKKNEPQRRTKAHEGKPFEGLIGRL